MLVFLSLVKSASAILDKKRNCRQIALTAVHSCVQCWEVEEGMVSFSGKEPFIQTCTEAPGSRPLSAAAADIWPGGQTAKLCGRHLHPSVSLPVCSGSLLRPGRDLLSGIFFHQSFRSMLAERSSRISHRMNLLSYLQVLVSILFFNLLHALDLVPLQPYSRCLGERLLVPAICQSLHDVLSMWAQASSLHAGLYGLSLPLLPAVTTGFSFCLRLASTPSLHISAMISILSGTSFVITGKKTWMLFG